MSYIGNLPTNTAFVTDQFNGDGSTVAFTMSVAPASTSSVLVAVTGVLQDPSTYSVSGTTLTFSAAPPSGTGNISVRYLGIPASGVTTTAYRTVTEFTATAGQTTFSVPSYTAGYIDVFRNGSRLNSADFTASNGTTVVLTAACNAGDSVTTESFYVSSVLNAIPATAGAVNSTYLVDGGVTQAKLGANVAGNGPAFSACLTTTQNVTASTFTKAVLSNELFDTNNNFDPTTNYRFTPTVAGYYVFIANGLAQMSAGTGSIALTQIRKNGSTVAQQEITATFTNGLSLPISTVQYMNGSTDYVELFVYNNAGSSPSFGAGQENTVLSGCLVRAA